MSPTPEEWAENWGRVFTQFIVDLQQTKLQTHAAIAIVGATIIGDQLQKALLTKMRPMSNTFRDELFENYGPVSSFAARIALASGLGLVTDEQHADLLVIKSIRNAFAHTNDVLNFTDEKIVVLCKRLSTCDPSKTDYQRVFVASLEKVYTALNEAQPPAPPPGRV